MTGNYNKKRVLISSLLIIIMISALLILLLPRDSVQDLRPVKGRLNLSEWDFSGGRPSLAGEWEFYWDKLYRYSDFQNVADDEPQYVYVPKTWNSYGENGASLSGFGCATYRLKVIVDDASQPLSLRMDTISTAYRLFVNEKEIVSNGVVGTDRNSSVPDYLPVSVNFLPPAEEFYIIIQVSNYIYARGGIWYEINLGTPEQIETLTRTIIYKDAVLTGSLLIMALYYLSFYLVLQRDRVSLLFMLLCVIFMLRTSLYGDMFLVRLFPDIPFGLLIFLTYATLYWIPVVVYLMGDGIYPYKNRDKINKIFLAYGAVSTLVTACLPVHIYTAFVSEIEIIGVGMVVFSVIVVAGAYLRNEKGAAAILLAAFVILVTGIHDVFFQANLIHHSWGELASVGIFIFMFIFSFTIASRLSNAYQKEKLLNFQLGEALKKEKEATVELVKTELSFLKAQIKPHFLYNSLSVITALSTRDPARAKALLYDLSDYLRGSFNFENYNGVTPLESELATVRAYLSIEKERFRGKLNVEYDIDESVDIAVPLLTIQPLVENAIRHGIMKKAGGGTVWIGVKREEGGTVIVVRDDGVGLPEGKAAKIFAGEAEKSGVGLKNIQRRLILYYGHGLELQSREGYGTTATIRIPD